MKYFVCELKNMKLKPDACQFHLLQSKNNWEPGGMAGNLKSFSSIEKLEQLRKTSGPGTEALLDLKIHVKK